MKTEMRLGTFLVVLMVVLIVFGYLISDNINARQKLQQAQAQQQQLQIERERIQAQQRLLQVQQEALLVQLQQLQRDQEIQAIEFEGRVKLSGYVEYGDIVLARATLTYPKEMKLGDSEAIILTLIPSKLVASALENLTLNERTVMPTIQLSNELQINPIMKAGLSGVGFDIVASAKEQEINFDTPSEWVWTIKAKEEGSHILVIDIAIPSEVQGNEESIDAKVRLYPIDVKVIKPIKNQFIDLLPYIIPATSGLIGLIIGSIITSKRQQKDSLGKKDINPELATKKKKSSRRSTK